MPLVVYLHGSGGLGDDNLKQLAFGNIFGTRLWLLSENQKAFPCDVVAPQTDPGWIRYDFSQRPAKELPGFGDGNRLALEIVGGLGREFGIDERRIWVAGNSMGGAGVWNMLANRPDFFAVAESAVVESHPMTARGRLRHRCGTSMGLRRGGSCVLIA
jgi:predicted peptidase